MQYDQAYTAAAEKLQKDWPGIQIINLRLIGPKGAAPASHTGKSWMQIFGFGAGIHLDYTCNYQGFGGGYIDNMEFPVSKPELTVDEAYFDLFDAIFGASAQKIKSGQLVPLLLATPPKNITLAQEIMGRPAPKSRKKPRTKKRRRRRGK